ncbi:MAG: T9SS C-terminal target domain-containing protein [Bacteroidetes bacterium]|nr:MAG: T9SS C-terminal target domain-containing protein [Bacteroidota bacterium]
MKKSLIFIFQISNCFLYFSAMPRNLSRSLLLLLTALIISATLSAEAYSQSLTPFPVPEYDPAEAVVIRYPFNSNIWHIYEELIMECQEAAHTVLLVNNSSERSQMENLLYNAGIPTDNITLLMLPASRMWVRDHGPIAFSTATGPAFAQFIDYNGSGFNDQNLPASLAGHWGYQHYAANWILDGGNYMVDSHGRLFTTTRLYSNNPGVAPAEIQQFLQETMGVTEIITVNPQHDDYWGHIDMQMKLLNDTTIVISSVTAGHPNYSNLESNVAIIESLTAPNGNPYHIARLPKAENWKTYANALILNNKIIVPIYNHPNDQVALDMYSELMPDHTVVGINCNSIIHWGGAIHCITMQIFEWEPEMFELAVDLIGNGSVKVNGIPYQEPMEVTQGHSITLEAIPGEGFGFTGWEGDLEGTDNPAQMIVTGDIGLTAQFSRIPGNYMSIVPHRDATYDFGVETGLKFARVISEEKTFEGTSYYFSPTIEYMGVACFSVDKSFLGEKMVMLQNGDDLFFNHQNDTIRIKTHALPGEEWIVFQNQDFVIKGEVIAMEEQDFLGVIDSVKTIAFSVYDLEMETVDHLVNDLTLKLSKNHGMLQVLNFTMFPFEMPGYNHQFELKEIELAGLSNPDVGEVNLTWDMVHDHQPGDELHITNTYQSPEYSTDIRSIHRFLERSDEAEHVSYLIERRISETHQVYPDAPSHTFTHDTTTVEILPNLEFDIRAGEPIFDYENSARGYLQVAKTKVTAYWWLIQESEDCWHEVIWDKRYMYGSYYEGLGGPYYSYDSWFDQSSRLLVYYKKGDTTWGTPLVITSVDEVAVAQPVWIYPNPARNSISFQHPENWAEAVVEVFDPAGKLLWKKPFAKSLAAVDVSSWERGVYFYRLSNPGQTPLTGKFILQ